ncbi:MAG: pentapeptide repeat-containing protein [Pseudomonadota bacterium]
MTDIERINALTTNARNTWLVLLAALVFVGTTLMSVEHIDFYGVDRATTLPLVNIEVPTRAFFVAAPLLIAAIYCYFHLYLLRLWDALSAADAEVEQRPLGDAISPWLISDAALHMRARLREDSKPPTTHRVLESTATWLNFVLAWAFGLIVIGLLWWLSMPARTFSLTLSSALSLFFMSFTGLTSFFMLRRRMTSSDIQNPGHIFRVAPGLFALVLLCLPLVYVSYIRTEGEFTRLIHVFPGLQPQAGRLEALETTLSTLDPTGRILTLAPLNLTEEQVIKRPQGWLPYGEAQKDYFAKWCKREASSCKRTDLTAIQERAFITEWSVRRTAARDDLQKPNWNDEDADKPDLRNAIMRRAFLSGAHLPNARMKAANLRNARMEGANLSGADLVNAKLDNATMFEADLSEAQLERASLSFVQLETANLENANLTKANLNASVLTAADLGFAQLEMASFGGAQMFASNLRGAQMVGTKLGNANLERADLSDTHLIGSEGTPNHLQAVNLEAAINFGGALRFVDLTEVLFDGRTDFRNAFLDGSVTMTDAFRAQLGDQCQSRLNVVLSDEEFYGLWLGWLEAEPNILTALFFARDILPEEWSEVEAIAPDPGCEWKPAISNVDEASSELSDAQK